MRATSPPTGDLVQEAARPLITTCEGTVSAASGWDEPVERKTVQPALNGSVEDVFHRSNEPDFLLPLRTPNAAADALDERRLERAIGVIYRPQTERLSHYFFPQVARQFDAVIHFDRTRAVEPFNITDQWQAGDVPETFPSGV